MPALMMRRIITSLLNQSNIGLFVNRLTIKTRGKNLMQMMKWSMMALAIAAATTQLAVASSQSDAKGFVEDSSVDLLSRNYAFQRDFKNNAPGKNMTNEWAQGEMLTLDSGFTQGTVGFGVDAFGYLGIKLNSGKGTTGTGLLSTGDDGRAHDEYSKASGALKMRVSDTVAKYGDMIVAAPVYSTSGTRLLPETSTGFNIMSQEIAGLAAEAGHFTATSARNGSNFDDSLNTEYSGVGGIGSISYLGASYAVTDSLSTSLYASEVEDNWRQYYGNINYGVAVADDQSAAVDFTIYRTNDYGNADSGNIGNTTFSLSPSYTIGAHTFTLAYQQVDGNTPFDYVGADSIWVANSLQYSDFNAAGMKSYKAQYNLNMASYGVPGLTFKALHVIGNEGDATTGSGYAYGNTRGAKAWETDFDVKYVVQEGSAKDLSLRLRSAVFRGNTAANNTAGNDANEVRLIIDYPLSIL
jgi:imipenem/basic amino acid-specific outer membrane pore